jgi:UDP-N-acetylglucosamine transferase subunit ALG13
LIFLTVGTQGPFDRMVDVVDDWARRTARSDVFAQVGPTENPPRHIRWVRSLPAAEFTENVERAQVVVSHAGMGTIITALEFGTPLILMPRCAAFHEQRNDHQVATARRFKELGRIAVAFDEHELAEHLNAIDELSPTARRAASSARQTLIETLCRFVAGEAEPAGTGSPPGLQPENKTRDGEG